MKILYHHPNPETIYANRSIYQGFKNAFVDLGHEFHTLTAGDDMREMLDRISPDIFLTSSHFFYQKFINYSELRKYRDRGLFVLTKVDFWNSPINKLRINEAKSLKDDVKTVELIKEGLLGDAFFHVVEQGDERMDGFTQATGYEFHTIPLAADRILLSGQKFVERFKADVSFIGTYLPQKRQICEERLFPLQRLYDTKIYGQDWTWWDKGLGFAQKVGQYFNVPGLKSFRKPKLQLHDEGNIYRSSLISINIHEDYQRQFGGDCNERTFKVPFCGGFEITDDVACIRKYFAEDEMVIAESAKDWFEKIDYFVQHPDERLPLIEKGRARVARDHTYHNRVEMILRLKRRAAGEVQV
jgi:spore maturation protein CgeB